MKKKYSITGIDCANCAAKLEVKMNELPQVEQVTLTFATQQLLVEAGDPDAVIPLLQELADKIEPGTKIGKLLRGKKSNSRQEHHHEHGHHHGEGCACGEHHHEHGHHHGEGCVCGEHHHEHAHHHGEECTCVEHHHEHAHHHTQEGSGSKIQSGRRDFLENREAVSLVGGAFLFAAAMLIHHMTEIEYLPDVLFVISYVILGAEIVITAARNLFRGKMFDENFLMTIATIGAFAIGDFAEAVGVMLFYRVGEFFEDVAVNKSRKQIMDAVDMRPEVVRLSVDGKIVETDPEEINIGDIIEIRPGDRIPLDGKIIRGESRIDTSAVTGEPVPVAVGVGSQIFSGCVNTSGVIYLEVEKLLEDSMVTRILEAVENAAASKPKIDRFITKFARIYTPFVVFLALGTAIIPSLVTGHWSQWVYTALSFLIISCPCALVLSVPLAFFAGIGAGSKRGILFKGGAALEMLADIKAVVMDKTGTITEGNFKVESVKACGNFREEQILSWAASAESASTHPIAASIREAAAERKISYAEPEEIKEISGEGMEVILARGLESSDGSSTAGSVIDSDGNSTAGSVILCGNQKLLARYGITIPQGDLEDSGTEVFVAYGNQYSGRILINDIIKQDSKNAIQSMSDQGLYTAMLTGDTKKNAEAVQKVTGIDEVFARQMPEDKLNNLEKIRTQHGAVMFIGDGINDAPVLAGADIGAAMGSGADAAIEAADVVFMNSRLTSLVESFRIAKATSRIAKENVIFALAVKAAVMVLGLCGIASMWMAVFADSGVAMLCVLNSIRVLYRKKL